jgi:Anti-sigma factor NepR
MTKKADRDDNNAGRESELGAEEKMPERGFDRWLNRQLRRLYDPVLTEAVPEEIMRLVERFDPEMDEPSDEDDDGSKP